MPTPRPRLRTDSTVSWQASFHYYDLDGRPHQSLKSFDDRGTAEWWSDLIERVGLDAALKVIEVERDACSGAVLLTGWLTRYTDRLVGVQGAVRCKYHSYICNDIAPFFGEQAPIYVVTRATDRAWIGYLELEKGNAPKTIKNKHGFLSAGLHAAVEQRPAPFNPCAGVRLPRDHPPEVRESEVGWPNPYGLLSARGVCGSVGDDLS